MTHKSDMNENDLNLYKKIQTGDRIAFEILFKRYYVSMVAFANTFLHDLDNAENLVQETFVKLWENRRKYEIKSFKNYLLVAVRNSCQNDLKKNKKSVLYDNLNETGELAQQENYSDFKVINQINNVIEKLPEQRKKIFKLNRLDGLRYKEIADKLNISPKTVEVQMGKALKFLRTQLLELKKQVYHTIL